MHTNTEVHKNRSRSFFKNGGVVINLMREKKELWDLKSLQPACALPTPLKPVLSTKN